MQSIRFGLIVVAICGIAALGGRIQVTSWLQQAAILAGRQENVTDQIIELRNAMTAIADLETGQRGYLLTGEGRYLEPYNDGSRRLDRSLYRLKTLFAEDPATLPEIEDITRLVRAKEQELARTVALRQAGDAAGALAVVNSGEGQRVMANFRQKTDAVTVQLRRMRAALVAKEAMKFHQVSVLGSVVVVLMILLIAGAVGWLSLSIRRLDSLQRAREQEAMHDVLTTLPNRRYLNEWLKIALAAARRNGKRLVLLYFDLNGFKGVNDRLGHAAGDRVLQVTAERLRGCVRSGDFVARLGGDEFVAVLPDAPADAELGTLLSRLRQAVSQAPLPVLGDGEVSASVGLASYPQDGDDPEALLRVADRAMYSAKQGRRNAGMPVAAFDD